MANRIARLSDEEVSLLIAGKENPDLLSNYFFRRPGYETGWVLDDNFDPEGAWQKKVHHASQTRIFIIGGFGSGKAQPLTSNVVTPTGYVKMGDINIGDKVAGQDGRFHKVKAIYPQPDLEVFKITFSDGSFTECTGDHLWNVRRGGKKNWKTLSLNEIIKWMKQYERPRLVIPITKPVEFENKKLLLDPYFLGLLLGDGCLKNDSISIATADNEILEFIKSVLPDPVCIKHRSNYDYDLTVGNISGYGRNKNPIFPILRELNILGVKSKDKFIPKEYLINSIQNRIDILSGLLDTDGSVIDGTKAIEYSSSSLQLAEDVQFIVESLGGRANITKKKTTCLPSYRLYIVLPENIIPFKISRKRNKYLNGTSQRGVSRAIVSIESVGIKKTQCISVESENNLYLTDRFIVTHNTRGIGTSACMWGITTRDFAFMNCAPTAYQALIMYTFIMDTFSGTRFADLIWKSPRTPYPMIELKFYAKNVLIQSKLEFMSIDRNAVQILSWEGDWVNLDEGGQIDNLAETLTNLGSRMRGSVNKRPRLGRLSLTSNSWDNPEMWARYDLAIEDPENHLSITVSSRHNHNITEQQLKMMLKDIPEDEHSRFIDGTRPEGKGLYFNKEKIYKCEDQSYGENIKFGFDSGQAGYEWIELRGSGVINFKTPKKQNGIYMILGDPGTGNAPLRNSPVIMVFDISDFPSKPTYICSFWWGFGNGSITPFIRKLMKLMMHYNPIFTGIDSTGPQSNTAEVINTYLNSARETGNMKMEWLGDDINLSNVMNPWISGMDFSGTKKSSYLVSGKMFIEALLVRFPKQAEGIRRQLSNYDPEKDTKSSFLAQDIVATFCMASYAIRSWFNLSPEELVQALRTDGNVSPVREKQTVSRLPIAERVDREGRRTEIKQTDDPRQDFPRRIFETESEIDSQ